MPSAKIWGRFFVRSFPMVVIDIVATVAAFAVSAFGTQVQEIVVEQPAAALQILALAAINVVVFGLSGLYSSVWKYASVYEVSKIFLATFVSTLVGDVVCATMFGWRMPLHVYICEWFILLVSVGASRLVIRLNSSWRSWSFGAIKSASLPKTLVVGAGESGSLAIKRMNSGKDSIALCPVALVDDDPMKMNCLVHGVRVVGTTDDIVDVCKKYEVEQIVLATSSFGALKKKDVLDVCLETGLKVSSVSPSIKEANAVESSVVLKDVEIGDLLAREEKDLDLDLMDYVKGRSVLVTGGGGSIGSELVRQLIPARPSKIVIFDIYENTAYELLHEMKAPAAKHGVDMEVRIGSITRLPQLNAVFDEFSPQVVFHAAAHKHVPLMEDVPREAIENNIFGTYNVAQMAHERGCTHFILISTDKAVRPSNVMGATKRCCEMIIQYFSKFSRTKFAAVRFGNVLGSHGSVIPLFKRQLKNGGPITVTHQDVTRYFMTIPEASKLVITAGALAKGGDIFVLDMGEPVKIYDLAVKLIRLSGFKVKEASDAGPGIAIRVTGLRPGEKLYEELSMPDEPTRPTANGQITVICGMRDEVDWVNDGLALLRAHIEDTPEELKRCLAKVVTTYEPQFEQAHASDSDVASNSEYTPCEEPSDGAHLRDMAGRRRIRVPFGRKPYPGAASF